jgi:serine protease Do
MKKITGYFIIGIISAFTALAFTHYFNKNQTTVLKQSDQSPFKLASYNNSLPSDAFVEAAKVSTPAVVHINTIIKAKKVDRNMRNMNPFFQFFGDPFGGSPFEMPQQEQQVPALV